MKNWDVQGLTYLPYVDGLRALAIMAVVAYHAFPKSVTGGFVGVDVFFVISGFLITRFIAAEIAEGKFSLTRFFVRRARRLVPAALVCFAIVAALASFVLLPNAFWYFGRSLVAALLMYANIFFYRTSGYFSEPALEKPLLHTWSLSVEDQFYLTWPLLLMLVMPLVSRRVLLAIVAVIAAMSLAYAEWHLLRNPEFSFFMLPTRAWELLLGAAIALSMPLRIENKAIATGVGVAGLVSILASIVLLSENAHFPGIGALPAALGTAAIIVSGLATSTPVTRLLSLRPVVFVGLISYSLYLWHWPLLALQSYRLEREMTLSEVCVTVAISAVLAILSWRYVERPFRARHGGAHDPSLASASGRGSPGLLKRPFSADLRFAIGAVASVVAVLGIAIAIKAQRGMPWRYDGASRTMLEQMVASNPRRSRCDNYDMVFANDAFCNVGRRKGPRESYEAALFGDSMGDHWAALLEYYAVTANLASRQVTNGGCGLLFGVDLRATPASKARECAAYQRAAEKFIEANPRLKVAFISGLWEKWGRVAVERNGPPAGSATAGGLALPTGNDERKRFEAILDYTVRRFTDRGIKVVLIGQVPTYDAIPTRCLISALRNGTDSAPCGKTRAEGLAELALSNDVLQRMKARNPMVEVFLPSDVICRGTNCSFLVDGTLIYRNGGHLNSFGAKALARYMPLPGIASLNKSR